MLNLVEGQDLGGRPLAGAAACPQAVERCARGSPRDPACVVSLDAAGEAGNPALPAGPAVWRYTTEAIRNEHRPDYWRQAIAESLHVDVAVQPSSAAPFDIRMALLEWDRCRLLCMQGTAHTARRCGPGRADAVSLMLQLEGLCTIAAGRRCATLGPGDVLIVPPDWERFTVLSGRYSHVLVDVEGDLLHDLLPQWKSLTARPFPAAHPAAVAMVELARWMLRHGAALPVDARAGLGETMTALIPGLDEPAGRALADLSRPCAGPASRAQRQRVEAFIRDNLTDAQLSVGFIARELGLSVRYLHKLFAGGPGVMQWVLEQRLLACRQELSRRGTRPVASIAYGWGFASPSHFSRVFRQRFGVSPRQA